MHSIKNQFPHQTAMTAAFSLQIFQVMPSYTGSHYQVNTLN